MNGRQVMYIPPQFEDDEAPADLMYSPRRQYMPRVFEHDEAPADLMYSPRRQYMPRVFEHDEAPADLMYSPRRQYMPHRVFEHDEAPADRMYSPRPQRLRTPHQESVRQRKITRRAVRRARLLNPDNIFLNAPPDNPRNIFLNPIQRMPRPPPVGPRQQPPNPASKRSLRKASRQRRAERSRMIADGWVFGGKTRRHRRY